jgi:hypothetical protein
MKASDMTLLCDAIHSPSPEDLTPHSVLLRNLKRFYHCRVSYIVNVANRLVSLQEISNYVEVIL